LQEQHRHAAPRDEAGTKATQWKWQDSGSETDERRVVLEASLGCFCFGDTMISRSDVSKPGCNPAPSDRERQDAPMVSPNLTGRTRHG
jgi:hypothetical protein